MKVIWIMFITLCLLSLKPMGLLADVTLEIGPTIKTPNVVIVCADGTEAQNGAALINAVNQASEYTPTLIKLEPGVYDIGTNTLLMKNSVDLEGSGRDITIITGTSSSCDSCFMYGVLRGANKSEVRNLSIKNVQTSIEGIPYGVVNTAGNPKFTNVYIYVQAAASANVEAVGMYNVDAGNLYLTDVEIEVDRGTKSYGIKNVNSNPWLTKVQISVNSLDSNAEAYGIYNKDSSPWIKYCEINAYFGDLKCYAIYGEDTNTTHDSLRLYWSDIIAAGTGGSVESAGVYGDEYQTSYIFSTIFTSPQNVGGSGTAYCTNCANNYLKSLSPTCVTIP